MQNIDCHTTVFSDVAQVQALVTTNRNALKELGIGLSLKLKIPYGTQVRLERSGENGLINIYYSKKKGLSFVDCSQNSVSRETIAFFKGEPVAQTALKVSKTEQELCSWIGTDESGKGDFFGPLVVAGFYTVRQREAQLIDIGVCDSKLLTSSQIRSIAALLWERFGNCIEVIAPSNREYNELYASMRNLNVLLAWAHARVIESLIQGKDGRPAREVDGVVTDKFGDERHMRNALSSFSSLNLIQRPKGESNIAVAAASIIARDCFEKKMDDISKKHSMKIPFGAGNHVTAAAREFARKYGRDTLNNVAKIHFKTYAEI